MLLLPDRYLPALYYLFYLCFYKWNLVLHLSKIQAEATLVNGRIRGTITNSEPEELNGKYVRIDFYSKRDVFLGRRYIEVKDLEQNGTMSFEVFFKLQEVGSYEVVIADKKEPADEIEWVPKDWTKPEIIAATIITLLILM